MHEVTAELDVGPGERSERIGDAPDTALAHPVTPGDEGDGFAAVQVQGGGQIGAAEQPGALDLEAGGEGRARQNGVVQ